VQIADRGVGDQHLAMQGFQRFLAPAALEIMPERGQASDLAVRGGQMLALQVGFRRRCLQTLIDIREPRVLRRFRFRLVLRQFSRLLLARQIGGECRELLMASFPQGAQLKEYQGAEARLWIAE
jgi:hypothetical protein